jgi:hypothetical protein
MILAVNALQIAIREKNIANPIFPADDRLFPPVNTDGCDVERRIASAITGSACQAVGVTLPGTNDTVFQLLQNSRIFGKIPTVVIK